MRNLKRSLRVSALILVFSFCLLVPRLNLYAETAPPAPDAPVKPISMDFQDANLKDLLKAFSIQAGLNFIASEAVQDRKVTLYLDKVPLEDAMDKLFKANNLSYEIDRKANIFMVKDLGKPKVDTLTRIFNLKYATVSNSSLQQEKASGGSGSSGSGSSGSSSGIIDALNKLISENGAVIEDARTNSIIVIETPLRMPIIAQTIAALDVPVPQAMLEVEILDVSKNSVDKIGFKYGQTPFSMTLTGSKFGTLWPIARTNLPMAAISQFTAGSLDMSNAYKISLDFLKTQADTKYLARPRILTLNNQTAEIKITTQETVGLIEQTITGAASTTTATADRQETGITLRVTPQINIETGEVTMYITPIVKDTSTSTFLVGNSGSTFYKDPEERSTKAMVRVKDGETVILGGLLRNQKTVTITKLPFLGDIPLVGALFRHKDVSQDKERELLVFITPHIIKDSAIELAQAKKVPVFPEREQSVAAVLDRRSAVSTTLNTFEKKYK